MWEEEEENAQRALNGVKKQPLAVKQEEVEEKEGETNNNQYVQLMHQLYTCLETDHVLEPLVESWM